MLPCIDPGPSSENPVTVSKKVIREDFTIEAYDILELHCELVAERMRLVASQKEVPPDMEQAVCTIIWAADRAEVSACCCGYRRRLVTSRFVF